MVMVSTGGYSYDTTWDALIDLAGVSWSDLIITISLFGGRPVAVHVS